MENRLSCSLGVVIILVILSGCSNSYLIEDNSTQSLRNISALNYLSKSSTTKIQMRDGYLTSVSFFYCTQDSLTYIESFSDIKRTVPVTDIDVIIVRSLGPAIAKGVWTGLVSGLASVGVIGIAAASSHQPSAMFLTYFIPPIAAVIGFAAGTLTGIEREYRFTRSIDNKTEPESLPK